MEMTKRQTAFRADYRTRIAGAYNGPFHVALIFVIGFATIWICAHRVHAATWRDWLIIPVTVVAANLFEWLTHRYVMHRPVKGLMSIYRRHTLAHHQFFTEREPSIDSLRDFRIVFFPPYAQIAILAMLLPAAGILFLAGAQNACWLLLCTAAGLYLNYELFHYCCHVKDDRLVRHIPLVNTIRRHHIAHHNQSIMMDTNMNLTYPFADWLFGTSDLERGILGHLFNGYDGRFVKTNLKKARATLDDPTAGRVRA
jgi:hypothetical protein